MYYQNYDDYMNSMLGVNRYDSDLDYTYDRKMYDDFEYHDLNELYPDAYKIVYPAVCKECIRNNQRGFSKSTIEEMVDRVYYQVQDSEIFTNEVREEKRNSDSKGGTLAGSTSSNMNKNEKETRGTMNNNLLRDFIKVLLLRELIGNRPNWNCRPGQNCRPPYPGPGWPGRPPFPPPNRPY